MKQSAIWKIKRWRFSPNRSSDQVTARRLSIPLPSSTLTASIMAAVLLGAAVFGWQLWPRDPGSSSPEAGFLRDMSTHHSQAVEMALIIRDRTSDPQLKALATDIALSQTNEMGLMRGYLDLWGLPLTGDDIPMTWMGMPTEGPMPGMATPEDVERLRTLPVDQAEMLFLQFMIRHHQGGVEMAQAVLDRSDQKQVTFLAGRIVMLQNAEIGTMNSMLEDRGEAPITDPLPDSHGH